MQILLSVLIGGFIGGLVGLLSENENSGRSPAVATGILGALLGLVTDSWMGTTGLQTAGCEYIASASGATLCLFLWIVAQRLFLADPPTTIHESEIRITR